MMKRPRRRNTLFTNGEESAIIGPYTNENKNAKENDMERLFKKVTGAGVLAVILGIVTITTGIAVGVLSIISGARLLRERDVITF